jgi:hypothetical protein
VFGDILMQVVEWHDVSTLAKASHYFWKAGKGKVV